MDYEEIVKRWQQNPILDRADTDLKLRNFRVLFAFHSGKIGNDRISYNDTRDIFENGTVSHYTGDVRTLFEQKNQKDCYEMLGDGIVKKVPLSLELIKQIHFELTKGAYDQSHLDKGERPGELKKHDYVIGCMDAGSPALKAESDLSGLLEEIKASDGDSVLKAAARLHAGFENIRPFADGNGRAGRTVMNYHLMLNSHPPIILFEEDRKKYYKALEQFDRKKDSEPLTAFLTAQCEKTWNID